jgi:hypothetical protein
MRRWLWQAWEVMATAGAGRCGWRRLRCVLDGVGCGGCGWCRLLQRTWLARAGVCGSGCGRRGSAQAASIVVSAGRHRRQLQLVRGGDGGYHGDWRRFRCTTSEQRRRCWVGRRSPSLLLDGIAGSALQVIQVRLYEPIPFMTSPSNMPSRVFYWISSLLTTLHQYSWRTSGHNISMHACRSKCESISL